MSTIRELVPQSGAEPFRAALYVRISAEHHQSSASNQRSAICRHAEAQKLHITFICSEQSSANPESRNQS